jgi:hypothetical protein
MRTEITQFLFFVSTIRSLRETFLPTWECCLTSTRTYTMLPHALRPFIAALRRVKFGIEKRISYRPHAMLWLFKTYAFSAGMYVSQNWSTQFLAHNNILAILCRSHTWRFQKDFWELNLLLQTGVCFENACRNPCNFTGSGQLPIFGIG